jgi:tetraacyldisaccharide 4'-kinase
MIRLLLLPLSLIYCLVYFLWDLYWRFTRSEKTSSRVISVGNITVGGTGKTSLAEYIAVKLLSRGIKTAVVARGYKRPASSSLVICDSKSRDWESCGDEAAALARSVEGLEIYVDSSKTYAALKASADGHEAVVIDDGFQHRRLVRDLDIVCLDGDDPFGNGWLLPYGILREPLRSLKRADAFVIFSSSEDFDPSEFNLPREIPVFKARKIVAGLMTGSNETVDVVGKKVIGFCGIANPESFHNSLKDTRVEITAFERFKDHHIYRRENITRLFELLENTGADFAVTTLKDFVKLEKLWPSDKKLYYLKINLALDREGEFIRLLKNE